MMRQSANKTPLIRLLDMQTIPDDEAISGLSEIKKNALARMRKGESLSDFYWLVTSHAYVLGMIRGKRMERARRNKAAHRHDRAGKEREA